MAFMKFGLLVLASVFCEGNINVTSSSKYVEAGMEGLVKCINAAKNDIVFKLERNGVFENVGSCDSLLSTCFVVNSTNYELIDLQPGTGIDVDLKLKNMNYNLCGTYRCEEDGDSTKFDQVDVSYYEYDELQADSIAVSGLECSFTTNCLFPPTLFEVKWYYILQDSTDKKSLKSLEGNSNCTGICNGVSRKKIESNMTDLRPGKDNATVYMELNFNHPSNGSITIFTKTAGSFLIEADSSTTTNASCGNDCPSCVIIHVVCWVLLVTVIALMVAVFIKKNCSENIPLIIIIIALVISVIGLIVTLIVYLSNPDYRPDGCDPCCHGIFIAAVVIFALLILACIGLMYFIIFLKKKGRTTESIPKKDETELEKN